MWNLWLSIKLTVLIHFRVKLTVRVIFPNMFTFIRTGLLETTENESKVSFKQ